MHQWLQPEGVELSKELILEPFALPHQLAQLVRIAHFEAERLGLNDDSKRVSEVMDSDPEFSSVVLDVHLATAVQFKKKPPENLFAPRMTWYGELGRDGRLKNG